MAGIRGTIRVLHWDRAGRGDTGLLAAARDALSARLGAGADSLTLRAHHGVVTIRGEVDQMADIETFERIVRAVPGVAGVDNLLRLRLAGRLRPRVLSA